MALNPSLLGQVPPDPSPGTTGHFAHHTWLVSAVEKIRDAAVPSPTTPTVITTAQYNASDTVLKLVIDALVAAGLVTVS